MMAKATCKEIFEVGSNQLAIHMSSNPRANRNQLKIQINVVMMAYPCVHKVPLVLPLMLEDLNSLYVLLLLAASPLLSTVGMIY